MQLPTDCPRCGTPQNLMSCRMCGDGKLKWRCGCGWRSDTPAAEAMAAVRQQQTERAKAGPHSQAAEEFVRRLSALTPAQRIAMPPAELERMYADCCRYIGAPPDDRRKQDQKAIAKNAAMREQHQELYQIAMSIAGLVGNSTIEAAVRQEVPDDYVLEYVPVTWELLKRLRKTLGLE